MTLCSPACPGVCDPFAFGSRGLAARPRFVARILAGLWALRDSNPRPPPCKSATIRLVASALMTCSPVDLRFRVSTPDPNDVLSVLVMARSFASCLQTDPEVTVEFWPPAAEHHTALTTARRRRRANCLASAKSRSPTRAFCDVTRTDRQIWAGPGALSAIQWEHRLRGVSSEVDAELLGGSKADAALRRGALEREQSAKAHGCSSEPGFRR